jgi:hypothetical protein
MVLSADFAHHGRWGNAQVLHSNIASAKLDAAALSIIKAAYAFVALQGEAGNKTTAMQTKKQRRRVSRTKSGRVAPEPAQGVPVGAAYDRQWWIFDSTAATKQRVVLLAVGRIAKTDACAPAKGPKAPPMPRPLITLATMAPAARLATRGS